MSRLVPSVAWRLLPSFRTDMVNVVGASEYFGNTFYRTSAGREIRASDLFDTEAQAIEAGFAALTKQAAHITKLQDGMAKKYAALNRCAAALQAVQS